MLVLNLSVRYIREEEQEVEAKEEDEEEKEEGQEMARLPPFPPHWLLSSLLPVSPPWLLAVAGQKIGICHFSTRELAASPLAVLPLLASSAHGLPLHLLLPHASEQWKMDDAFARVASFPRAPTHHPSTHPAF